MGDFKKGLEFLHTAASLDPECPIPYVNAARAYLGMNDTKAARRQVVAVVQHKDVMLFPMVLLSVQQQVAALPRICL